MKQVFRARSARALYESHHGPNMTPMVDVVMVILIFFMASAAIMGPEWFVRSALPVEAPGATPDQPPPRLHVRLMKDGVARLRRDEETDFDTIPTFQVFDRLRNASRESASRLVVLVEPDPDATYDDVVRIHEWCARLGIAHVGLSDAPHAGDAPTTGP